jgi:hypothetical protein
MAVASAALLFVACVGGANVSGDLRNVGSVTVTFKVAPARAKVGQAVRFSLRLSNNAGRDEELTYPTGQRYDFWTTSGSREAWRWSDGRVFTQATTKESIGAQSGLIFSESWTPERAGTYVAHGRVTADGYERELTGKLEVQ